MRRGVIDFAGSRSGGESLIDDYDRVALDEILRDLEPLFTWDKGGPIRYSGVTPGTGSAVTFATPAAAARWTPSTSNSPLYRGNNRMDTDREAGMHERTHFADRNVIHSRVGARTAIFGVSSDRSSMYNRSVVLSLEQAVAPPIIGGA